MKTYHIEGKTFLLHDGRLFMEVPGDPAETGVAGPALPAATRRPVAKKDAQSGKGSGRKCGKCGRPGHTYRTCPKTERLEDYPDKKPAPVSAISEEGLREKVLELKDEGLDALRIAARLKIPLGKAKDYMIE